MGDRSHFPICSLHKPSSTFPSIFFCSSIALKLISSSLHFTLVYSSFLTKLHQFGFEFHRSIKDPHHHHLPHSLAILITTEWQTLFSLISHSFVHLEVRSLPHFLDYCLGVHFTHGFQHASPNSIPFFIFIFIFRSFFSKILGFCVKWCSTGFGPFS